MNRPFVRRGKPVAGVVQRCRGTCPKDTCGHHRWSYAIELPAGPTGERRQLTKGGYLTGKEAMQARADVAKQHRDGTLPADDKRLLGSWLEEWLKGKVSRRDIEDTTARGYSDNIRKYIKPKLGHLKVRELRGVDLTRFYAEIARERQEAIDLAQAKNDAYRLEAEQINARRRAEGKVRMTASKRCAVPRPLSPASIARIHACLSGALGDAVPDLVPRNVAADAKLPKVDRKKVRPPTPEAYGAFLDVMEGERLYPLLVLAGFSGLRRGELCGLRWSDLDLKTGRLVVAQQRVSVGYQVRERDTKTEAGQDRVVFLDSGTVDVIKAWRKAQLEERLAWGEAYADGGYIFTKEDGTPLHPDAVTKLVSRLARRAELPATLHTFRHFRAAALISTGADIAAVSKAMGHANIAVTSDIYGTLFEKANQEMSEKAAGLVPRRRRTA
jgi:integrase